MSLPLPITEEPKPGARGVVLVKLDGATIGEYHKRHSGGGYRFRTIDGAWGDCSMAHLCVVGIVELYQGARKP